MQTDLAEHTWGVDFHALRTYERNLPHWRQEGAVYFVTFRLKDSIPRAVLEEWMDDRRKWLAVNGVTDDHIGDERRERYLTIPLSKRRAFERDETRRLFSELDRCHSACCLRRREAAEIVQNALRFFDGERLLCGDFVVMPNHVHWLLVPLNGHKLEDILHSVKQFTALRINRFLGQTGNLWQRESFDRIVRNSEEFERIRSYIQRNPGAARLKPGEFLHHSEDWTIS